MGDSYLVNRSNGIHLPYLPSDTFDLNANMRPFLNNFTLVVSELRWRGISIIFDIRRHHLTIISKFLQHFF